MTNTLLSRTTLAVATFGLVLLGPGVPAGASPTGLDGFLTDALTGAPVTNAEVVIEMPDGSHFATANPDATGHFDAPNLTPGQYIVEVDAAGYLTQWAYGHPADHQFEADPITVPGTISIPLQPLQYGSITGHIHDDQGNPVKNVFVGLDGPFGNNEVANTATDRSGAFHFDRVETHQTYTIEFRYPNNETVWFDNTLDSSSATEITVNPDRATVIDETAPPFGSVTLKAIDAVTRAPLPGVCFGVQTGPFFGAGGCTDATGKVKMPDIPVGTYGFGGFINDGIHLNQSVSDVVVTEDTVTNRTVKFQLGASMNISFIDSTTGEPVPDACALLVEAFQRNDPGQGCNGATPTLTDIFPGDYTLFIDPRDDVHGAQWAGVNGPTGDPRQAKVFSFTYGQHEDLTVRLDGAGSITGTITDAATGQPVPGVCPSVNGPGPGWQPGYNSSCTDAFGTGQYTISGLGPYQWEVVFPDDFAVHAWQWSGNAPNRAQATPVQVTVGGTQTVDAALTPTGTISGRVTVPAGACASCVQIDVVDATTGEFAGIHPFVNDDGTFTIYGLNTQRVWLYYIPPGADNAIKFPTEISTTAGQAVTGIDIDIPASALG